MRHRTLSALGVAVVVAALMGCMAAPAGAQGGNKNAPPPPTQFTAKVKGLDNDTQGKLGEAIRKSDAVGAVSMSGGEGTVTITVKGDKTYKLSDLAKACVDASTKEKPFEVQKGDIALVGTFAVTVTGKFDSGAVTNALKKAPNVKAVQAEKVGFLVTIDGSKGTKISEFNDALTANVKVAKEGDAPPAIDDVAWTAPKAPTGGGHG